MHRFQQGDQLLNLTAPAREHNNLALDLRSFAGPRRRPNIASHQVTHFGFTEIFRQAFLGFPPNYLGQLFIRQARHAYVLYKKPIRIEAQHHFFAAEVAVPNDELNPVANGFHSILGRLESQRKRMLSQRNDSWSLFRQIQLGRLDRACTDIDANRSQPPCQKDRHSVTQFSY